MSISFLNLRRFEKACSLFIVRIVLIFMLLLAVLPFSVADVSASTMIAPGPGTIPTIDGHWGAGEWDDAPQYNISGSGGTGYIRIKYDNTRLFIIIDSVWDTTLHAIGGSYEGTYVAFDTFHNESAAPQTDDYLFFNAYSKWVTAWWGNGVQWVVYPVVPSGFDGNQTLGTSPNNATAHRIDEMSVPLSNVGAVNSTSGFYVIVRDDDSDPDGYGPDPPTRWVEWPSEAGGDPSGWPNGIPYIDPCPPPSDWGDLTLLEKPTAAFTWKPLGPVVNELVTFNATDSQDDGSITNYTWDFDDGNITATTDPIIDHAFSQTRSYSVTLTVTDNDGLNASISHTINVGVTAAFTFSPSTPNPGDTVTFNATDSYSPGGTIIDYTWDFGDGNITTINTPIITHIFSLGEGYPVNLTVTDNLARKAYVIHTVEVGAPVADFTFSPSKPNARDATLFDATTSSDPDGIAEYAWNWGDSSSNVTASQTMTHKFSAAGAYTVNLTVTDNSGLRDSTAITIDVYAPRDAVFSFVPPTPNVGDVVTFNATLSKDPGGNIASYSWNFDDGNTTTTSAKVIMHAFSEKGSYTVNLTITDNDGLTSWYANVVNVAIPPTRITAPFSPIIPYIDGIWSSVEWTDGNEYIISGAGGDGYMRLKWGPGNITGSFLYIVIDSVWDATNATSGYENVFIAFDTEHDQSTVGPQTDDYLFNDGFSQWNFAWKGNGTHWVRLEKTDYTSIGYMAERSTGPSPKNATKHRMDEFRVPLAFVGQMNKSVGFYVMVVDSDSDPDGWGLNDPPTRWVQWPTGTGGDPRGWPVDPYIDPCPSLDKWSYLTLEQPTKANSSLILEISSSSITLGESVQLSGTVRNSTGTIAEVNVILQCRLTGTTEWINITMETTDWNGNCVHDWTPTEAGTYQIKASWVGDANNYGAESIETLEVTARPLPLLMVIAAAVVVVAVGAVIVIYFVRKKKA